MNIFIFHDAGQINLGFCAMNTLYTYNEEDACFLLVVN